MKTQEWIEVSERKPEASDLPIWVYYGKNSQTFFQISTHFVQNLTGLCGHALYSHWMHAADVMPAPPKELTQKEKDEDAWTVWFKSGNSSTHDAWHAALAWERSRKQ